MGLEKEERKSRDIAHSIFSGSTTMIGVCITVIALFRVLKISGQTYADEVLGIDTFLFILSGLLSYLTLRNNDLNQTERWADILFFTGMVIMVIVGLIIVFTAY
jgi:multisubunit Na+/H+ antiporter MnhF subunit